MNRKCYAVLKAMLLEQDVMDYDVHSASSSSSDPEYSMSCNF